MNPTPRMFGLSAVLIDCADLDQALALHTQLQQLPPQGASELIPAASTLLVRFTSPEAASSFYRNYSFTAPQSRQSKGAVEHCIEVLYDGQDLEEVAQLTGLSPQGVIDAHTSTSWQVAFAGFAPGFFYLHAQNNPLAVPRRSSPRTAVPAGAVGLAGEFSGIYPRTSPGGWQLIGRTTAQLWDLKQNPPALLEPGHTVRFKAVRELVTLSPAKPEENQVPAEEQKNKAVVQVEKTGAQLLFQDAGRRGLTHWGLSASGYADPQAAADANYLVGNRAGATVLESLAGGFSLRAEQDCVLALTGAKAEASIIEEDQPKRVVALNTPFALLAGQTLSLGPVTQGLRIYCALRGGFAVQASAQSASTDTMSGVGPEPLRPGQLLKVGQEENGVVQHPLPGVALPEPGASTPIRLISGPRADWFSHDSLQELYRGRWEVSSQSDRIGVRLRPLEGTGPLVRTRTEELASEGMIAGAMQVPPNGEPVIFLADYPVTGGYPVLASVHPEDLRLLAQAPAGTIISFRPYEKEETRA